MLSVATGFDGTPDGSRLFGRIRGRRRYDIEILLRNMV
jgi:hypothetical protein